MSPLVVDGVMYIAGAALIVQALDAATGKLLWTHAPVSNGPQRHGAGTSRGVTYWKDGDRERIFALVQNHILCLNAKSGKIVGTFGDNGVIDLEKDIDRDLTHGESIVATTLFAGIRGQARGRLPNEDVLMLSTMGGHGMVGSSLAKKMIDWVKEGRRTPEQAVTYLARFCSCGVFNPSRAVRILEDARKRTR